MIACCMSVCWRFFERNFKIFKGALLLLISCIKLEHLSDLGWKHTRNIETTEAEYSHRQKKELHDRVYQQNIPYEGLFFEELKFSLRFVFILTSRLVNNYYRYIPLLKSLKSHTSQKKIVRKHVSLPNE